MDTRRPRNVVIDVLHGITRHDATSLAAAIAFYTLFALAPMGILIVGLAGVVLGEAAARGEIAEALSDMLGPEQAKQVESIIGSASAGGGSVATSIVGGVSILFGAAGMFTQLTRALNAVWEVRSRSVGHGVWHFIRHRLVAIAMVAGVAALLMASALSSATVSATGKWVEGQLPGWAARLRLVNIGFSLGLMTVVFALMFKALPATRVPWRSLWVGSLVTALLFWAGKWLVGLYLGVSGLASAYGAAGSLVVLLLWVYYCSFSLLVGAEFTRAFAAAYESKRLRKNNHLDGALMEKDEH